MNIKRALLSGVALMSIAGFLALSPAQLKAQNTVAIDADDIGGVVTGPAGPEAGVWVIAETTDLGTKMAKMVVTDDQGRYVLPDLPKAKYKVWVRGYGLVEFAQGRQRARQAAQPDRGEGAERGRGGRILSGDLLVFDGQGPGRGPVPRHRPAAATASIRSIKTQGQYLDIVKTNGCVGCHQLGNKATRTIPAALGHFSSGYEAWTRRIQSGQAVDHHGHQHGADGHPGGPEDVRRLDRPRRRMANCRPPSRRGRRASSATP